MEYAISVLMDRISFHNKCLGDKNQDVDKKHKERIAKLEAAIAKLKGE